MNTVTKERMEEMEKAKEDVRKMNIEAVADLLVKMQVRYHVVLADNVDMKRMVTDLKQEILVLKAEVNALKTMGFKGTMGTGSTVHFKDE